MAVILTFPMRNDLPQYSFNITLSGTIFQAQILYNGRMDRWIMNINDSAGNQILSGIPVLIERDLTAQYATLTIPEGTFVAIDNSGQDTQATRFSFGLDHTLYYVDPSE